MSRRDPRAKTDVLHIPRSSRLSDFWLTSATPPTHPDLQTAALTLCSVLHEAHALLLAASHATLPATPEVDQASPRGSVIVTRGMRRYPHPFHRPRVFPAEVPDRGHAEMSPRAISAIYNRGRTFKIEE